jgi:hypothetical protein
VAPDRLRAAVEARAAAPGDPMRGWRWQRTERVASGFYTSQAVQLVAPLP